VRYGLKIVGRHNFPVLELVFKTLEERSSYIIKIASALKSGDKIELFEA
jgi:hypothetical protein